MVAGGLWRAVGQAVSGQMFYLLTQMGVIVALAQMRGVEAVGQLGLALGIATPVFMFAHMGLQTGIATDLPTERHRPREFNAYLGLALVSGLAGFAVSMGVGALVLDGPENLLLLAMVSVMKVAETFSKLCHGAFQRAHRMGFVAVSMISRGVATLLVFVALLLAGAPTGLAFAAQAVVWAAIVTFYDLPRARRVQSLDRMRPSLDLAALADLTRTNAPLALAACLIALMTSAARFFLDAELGLAAVGIFTAVSQIYQAGAMVVDAVNQGILSHFALWRRGADGRKHLAQTIRALVGIAALASVAGMALVTAAGEPVLALAFGPEFAAGRTLLILMAVALCARAFAVVPQGIIQADRRFGLYLVYQAASLAVMVALLPFLVPAYGLEGAGLALVAVSLFRLSFSSITAIRALRRGTLT